MHTAQWTMDYKNTQSTNTTMHNANKNNIMTIIILRNVTHNDYNEQWIKWITIMMQTTTITINNEQCQWTIISTTMKNENYVLQCLTKFVMKILL